MLWGRWFGLGDGVRDGGKNGLSCELLDLDMEGDLWMLFMGVASIASIGEWVSR